jgi:hypothetical protein
VTVHGCAVKSPPTGCQVTSRLRERFLSYSKWTDTFWTAHVYNINRTFSLWMKMGIKVKMETFLDVLRLIRLRSATQGIISPIHATRANKGSEGTAPPILNLCTRWRRGSNFMPWLFPPPPHLLNRRMTGLQSWSGCLERSTLLGIELCGSCSLYPILTELPLLLLFWCVCVCVCARARVNHISFNIHLFHVLHFFRNWLTFNASFVAIICIQCSKYTITIYNTKAV